MARRSRLSPSARARNPASSSTPRGGTKSKLLFKTIVAVAGPDRETWLPRLLAPIEDGGISRLEWLGAVPSGKGPTSLEAQIEKVGFLKQLGADRLVLPDLPLAGLKHFARRMMSRKAAALARIKDPHRTIEIACFLRLRLLQLTDASLTLLDHQIAAQWRSARERVAAVQASRLRRFHRLLGDLAALADDEELGAADLRSRLRDLIAPFEAERQSTRVAENSPGTRAQISGTGPAAEDGARRGIGGTGRPCGRNRLRDARFARRVQLRVAGGDPATVRLLVAEPHRPAGSSGGARLLSRRDRDGPQARAAERLDYSRSQLFPSCRRGQADPRAPVAALARPLHPGAQSARHSGKISSAPGSRPDGRACGTGRGGQGRRCCRRGR